MHKPKIDFLKEKYHLRAPRRSPVLFFGRFFAFFFALAAIVGIVFSYQVSSTHDGSGSFPEISLFSTLKGLVSSNDRSLEGEPDDRVNFLLMGIGGAGHSGPQLTDTIIFTSYQPSSGNIAMMSLPRDMSVPIPGYGYNKVNHANAYGEMNEPGAGPVLASQVIGDVLDQDIHYYLRVDFDGFAEFIDAIGGIDVYVDNGFTDPHYPTHGMEYADCGTATTTSATETESTTQSELAAILMEDEDDSDYGFVKDEDDSIEANTPVEVRPVDYSCRYESLTFYEGWTHMDGETALKFARSRHGNNGEGSDFARSRRQQKIILAVKDEVLSASTFLNPSRLSRMMETLEANIATNLDVWEIIRLANEFKDLDTSQLVHHVIDSSADSPLYASVVNGSYVLLPKNDSWTELQNIAEYIFTPTQELSTQMVNEGDTAKPRNIRLEIQNGTTVTGLASRTSDYLEAEGFEVAALGNATTKGYEQTIIYDLTNGQESEALRELRDFLGADVSLSTTGWMIGGTLVPKELSFSTEAYEDLVTADDVDFLVILGENTPSLAVN